MDTVKQMEADAKERAFRVRPIPFRAPMVRPSWRGCVRRWGDERDL